MGERVPHVDEAATISMAKPAERSRVKTASALPPHVYAVPEDASSPRYFQNVISRDTLLAVRLAKVQGFRVSAHCQWSAAKYRARKSCSKQFHFRPEADGVDTTDTSTADRASHVDLVLA
jgi:hypothetical protein